MSAYGKPQPPQLHGYDTGRSYPESSFSYAPSYGTLSSAQSSIPAPVFQNATQMTQMAYATGQARTTYDDQSGPYLNVGSTPIPEVTSYTPSRGGRGTKIYVYITSLYELTTTTSPIFFLMFGQRKCQASLTKMSQQGGVCQYTVATEVPQLSATSWSSSQVPIFMFMESGDGDVIAKVVVGEFTYVEGGNPSGTPQEGSRKRKISAESAELMNTPVKRVSSQQLKAKEDYATYGYSSTEGAPYSPYLQPSASYTGLMPQYNRPSGVYHGQPSPRHVSYGYPSSTTESPPTTKAQSPQVTSWSPAYSMARSPGVPSNASIPRPALTSLPSPATTTANPPLIRTSTLQQTPSPAATPHSGHPGQPFNAYALYPHKAKLEINGDLDSMAQNWTEEEWESQRRLVHFRRSQSGSTITATFQPVSAEDRPPNSVCISCIFWEDKQECFVTSVDTIYLLEQLVAARFTVEEKNRIRRNLEGFRPLTVSKGKSDSEEFFKVIMAFPNPKPRNIEKDVKVFHWKDLASALKKIIGKYSASPSSTLPSAPPLLTPVSSTGYATEGSTTGMPYAEHHGTLSPRSISGSTASTAYAANIPARGLSPLNLQSMAIPGGPPDLRIPVPQNPHDTSSHWQGAQHHMPPTEQYQQLGGQSRGSWDMSTYLESSPATGVGNAAQPPLNYQGSRNVSDPAGSGGRSLSSPQQGHPISRA